MAFDLSGQKLKSAGEFLDLLGELQMRRSLSPDDTEQRLSLADAAARAILNNGGVIPSDSKTVFSYAMTGHDMIEPPNQTSKKTGAFSQDVERLESLFDAGHKDTPFVPGTKSHSDSYDYFKETAYNRKWPRRVYIVGGGPFSPRDHGRGMRAEDASFEYTLKRDVSSGLYVGRIVVRDCFSVDVESARSDWSPRLSAIEVTRESPIIYEARRKVGVLLSRLPKINMPQFGMDIKRPPADNDYFGPDDTGAFHDVLIVAQAAARNRGDYNSLPLV